MTNSDHNINDLIHLFLRLGTKFVELEKKAVDLGTGEKLYPTELHIIDAIGSGNGNTVTELCEYFDVTKGAVSQSLSRLERKGHIEKRRNKNYSKEKIISLTPKGIEVFTAHQALHKKMNSEIAKSLNRYSESEIALLKEYLILSERNIQKFIDL